MADHGGGGGGEGLGGGFLLLFFGAIVVIWFAGGMGEGGGLFGGNATSTQGTTTGVSATRNASYRAPDSVADRTSAGIESEVRDVAAEVSVLKGDVREAKIWGVRSPYAGMVELSHGNARSEDEDAEYLTLRNTGGESVSITDWRIESYVTGERGVIPQGASLPRSGRVNDTGNITLAARERAIVISGESPIGASFRENTCTGYFGQYQDFHPSLSRSCPSPVREMEEYGNIDLDDDACYEFVRTLPSCEVARNEARSVRISSSCDNFVMNDLTYSGCVLNHAYDEDFYSDVWRVYLGEGDDLWRSEREIVKLVDAEGRTVDVLEY